jgi:hypothetical protein
MRMVFWLSASMEADFLKNSKFKNFSFKKKSENKNVQVNKDVRRMCVKFQDEIR